VAGVATTHKAYDNRAEQWERCRDCSEGSDAVKQKGSKYLPMLDSHKDDNTKYQEYKLRALFYNAASRTVAGLSGAIFQKDPAIKVNSSEMEEQIKDVTLTNEPLASFALNATREELITGRTGVLVDMASEEVTKPRPYWLLYKAEDIINWKFTSYGGDRELSMVVLRECVEDSKAGDEFAIEQKERYRVLRLSTSGVYTQQIYNEKPGQEGIIDKSQREYIPGSILTPLRLGRPLDFIPFTLPWVLGAPPILDLVDVNLAHYRASADLKHGLHFTALPTPWVSGQNDTNKKLKIGSGTAWALDTNGRAGMLEFTGRGLGAIRTDIQDMQRMMATLGARLLEEAPHYAETALSVSMRHSSDYATLRMLAQVVEQQLSFSLKTHAWWLGKEAEPKDVQDTYVDLNKVFYDQSLTADQIRALLLALQANTISYKTFYSRLVQTGWTREGVGYEEELKDIDADPDFIGAPPPKPGAEGGAPKPAAGAVK